MISQFLISAPCKPTNSSSLYRLVTHRSFQTRAKQSLSSLATKPATSHDHDNLMDVDTEAFIIHAWKHSVTAEKLVEQQKPPSLEEILASQPKKKAPLPSQPKKMEQTKGHIIRDAFGNEIEVSPPFSANSATVESVGELLVEEAQKGADKLQDAALEPTKQEDLDKAAVDQMMNHLQFSNPESSLGFVHVSELLTEREIKQLQSKLKARAKLGKEIPECVPRDNNRPNEETPGLVQKVLGWFQLNSSSS